MLGHIDSRYIPSTYPAVFLLEYALEAMGKSLINPTAAQALARASEHLWMVVTPRRNFQLGYIYDIGEHIVFFLHQHIAVSTNCAKARRVSSTRSHKCPMQSDLVDVGKGSGEIESFRNSIGTAFKHLR